MKEEYGITVSFYALSLSQGVFFGGHPMEHKNQNLRKSIIIAMLAAVAYMLVATIRITMLPAAPFLKYEPKDVAITIGGFLCGPMASMVISLLVSLIEMFSISETGWIGCLMNFLSTCSFACTAALIYKKKHTLSGAVVGLVVGSVAMIGVMLLWNWLITPLYMGGTREAIAAMLVPVFLPFNALKAGFNSAIILCLYKPLTVALRKARLLPPSTQQSSKRPVGLYLFAAALLVTCVMFLLVVKGIL